MKITFRISVCLFGTAGLFAALLFLRPVPAAQDEPQTPIVSWRTDWEAARREAIAQNKPLFVRFRCFKMPPDLAALDAQIDRPAPGSPLQKLLAEKVVPVRLGSMKGVDISTFRFDYDLQLAGVVLDGRDGETLARWGTRDAQSATSRVSADGLVPVLQKATAAYATRKPTNAPTTPPRTLDTAYPAFAQTKRRSEPCWHCHYANDARIIEEKQAGTLRKAALFTYPLPETIGITLDPKAGNVVSVVRSNSWASHAGVRTGDAITSANQTQVYSSADLQAALNGVSSSGGAFMLTLRRGKNTVSATDKLVPGWREDEDISWRPSQGAVPPILGTWEAPLTPGERKAAGLPEKGGLVLRVTFVFAGEKWAASHGDLQVGDVILAVNDQSPPIESARQFHTWYRLHTEVGQTARFTVLRNGKRVMVPVACVDVSL